MATESLDQSNIVSFLEDIFTRRGADEYLGESVTMAEHMLQSAHFAETAGEAESVIVAALLHDIGHFTSEFGAYAGTDTEDKHHDVAGGELLESLFPKIVSDCARFHVAAKRYLCATESDYFDKLSKASVHTLSLQGGPMTDRQVSEFETIPHFKTIVNVRRYDEAGKEPEMSTPPFTYYAPMIQRVVDEGNADRT